MYFRDGNVSTLLILKQIFRKKSCCYRLCEYNLVLIYFINIFLSRFQVASRWVFVTVGILYMIFGVIGKFSAVFIAIPEPVLGGALICITGVFIGKHVHFIL